MLWQVHCNASKRQVAGLSLFFLGGGVSSFVWCWVPLTSDHCHHALSVLWYHTVLTSSLSLSAHWYMYCWDASWRDPVIILPGIEDTLSHWTFLSFPGHHYFPLLFPLKIIENNQEKNTHFTINKHATFPGNIISYPCLPQNVFSISFYDQVSHSPPATFWSPSHSK